MSIVVVMGVVALLFMVFGMLRLRGEDDCNGGSCASCGAICHLKGDSSGRSPSPDTGDGQRPPAGRSHAH
jgi:hypothetical protein